MLRNYLRHADGMRRIVVRPAQKPEADGMLMCERLVALDFPPWRSPLCRPDNALRTLVPALRTTRHLWQIVREERVDVIIANSYFCLLPLFPLTFVMKAPVIFVAHLLDYPRHLPGRALLSRCSFIACCSRAVYSSLASPEKKKRLLANAAEKDLSPQVDRSWRVALGWQNRWVAAYFGRLSPEKNLDALIQAATRIRQEGCNDLAMLLVGDGEERNKLETAIKDAGAEDFIHLLGFVPSPRPIMRAVDAVCLPSLAEPFGMSILEAQIEGIPVMGTAKGGIPEMIIDGQTGILARDCSVEGLADALRRLRLAAADSSMTENARRQASEAFSMLRQRRQFLDILADVSELTGARIPGETP